MGPAQGPPRGYVGTFPPPGDGLGGPGLWGEGGVGAPSLLTPRGCAYNPRAPPFEGRRAPPQCGGGSCPLCSCPQPPDVPHLASVKCQARGNVLTRK